VTFAERGGGQEGVRELVSRISSVAEWPRMPAARRSSVGKRGFIAVWSRRYGVKQCRISLFERGEVMLES
jgi:hypothetical protein